MSSKITFEEYRKRLSEATNTILPISDYIGWNKPIRYKCLVCDNEWDVKEARYVPRGYGCPCCANKKKREALTKIHHNNLKSEKQFRNELLIKQPNLIPNDTYTNKNTKYHCICKIHNCDVYKTPDKYLNANQGCDICSVERNKCATRYTDESYKEKAYSLNKNIKILSTYQNVKERIHVRCKVCNYEWNPIAETLIWTNPCGCPNCAGNAHKSTENFRLELEKSHPALTLLSEYISANEEVHIQCNDCGNDFWITPNKLQQGQQCSCNHESRGENKIRLFLENNNIEYIPQKSFCNLFGQSGFKKLSYDFYLPTLNLLIEYQGEQHENPVIFKGTDMDLALKSFERQQEHDKRKRDYAKEHNIELLEIWYWDFNNIEQILSEKIFSKVS